MAVRKKRVAGIAKAARSFEAWRPAREVLTEVSAVPTIFPQFDVAVRVGGLPIERITLTHGPSNHGKSLFVLGLGRSFLQAGHPFFFVDAEQTTPMKWVRELLGDQADNPLFFAERPESYEQAVDLVRAAMKSLRELRDGGTFPEATTALVAIDSLRKLTPKRLMDEVVKGADRGKDGKGVDGAGGRAGQYRAALNAAWLDELVPLLAHARAAGVLVARETENPDAGFFAVDYKVGGGRAVVYDSSLRIRVERASWTKGPDAQVDGERIRLTILKTKVGGKDDKVVKAYFHVSNGRLSPPGFDRARDVMEMARGAKIVEVRGAYFAWGDQRWRGEHDALKYLRANPEALRALEDKCRQFWQAPEVDPETEQRQPPAGEGA